MRYGSVEADLLCSFAIEEMEGRTVLFMYIPFHDHFISPDQFFLKTATPQMRAGYWRYLRKLSRNEFIPAEKERGSESGQQTGLSECRSKTLSAIYLQTLPTKSFFPLA